MKRLSIIFYFQTSFEGLDRILDVFNGILAFKAPDITAINVNSPSRNWQKANFRRSHSSHSLKEGTVSRSSYF